MRIFNKGKKTNKSTTNKTNKKINKKKSKNVVTNASKKIQENGLKPTKNTKTKNIDIGQTLETNDIYLPHKKNKVPESKSRPVIVVDKIKNPKGESEFAVVPGSTKDTANTTRYGKYGIKYYRHNIEVVDNENKPIKQNDKFSVTEKSTKLPVSEAKKIKDEVINHTRFSSENRRKYSEFQNRYKKSKG